MSRVKSGKQFFQDKHMLLESYYLSKNITEAFCQHKASAIVDSQGALCRLVLEKVKQWQTVIF